MFRNIEEYPGNSKNIIWNYLGILRNILELKKISRNIWKYLGILRISWKFKEYLGISGNI
jgi:hypothetical protein